MTKSFDRFPFMKHNPMAPTQAPAEGDATDLADFLANTLGFVGDVDDAAAEIVAFLASKAQPKGTTTAVTEERKLIGELRDALDRIVSYYKNPRSTITLWDQAKSDHEHTMFGAAIAILGRTKTE